MSASEKLKALDAAIPLRKSSGAVGPTGTGPEARAIMAAARISQAEDALRNALPQIIAVVEAAEVTEEHPNLGPGTNRICKICGYDLNFEGARNRCRDGHGPDCALDALEEALT